MGHPAERRYSWEEYLSLERETGIKHEYVDGHVYAMSAGTRAHARLAARIIRLADAALDGRPCATYTSDLKVWMPSIRTARYPDVSIVCGKPEGDTDDLAATTAPTVLFEVLSPSTERFDHEEKFLEYVKIPTLRDYVLVSTTGLHLTHWRRGDDGKWTALFVGSEDALELTGVEVRIAVADIYRDVELDRRPRYRVVRED